MQREQLEPWYMSLATVTRHKLNGNRRKEIFIMLPLSVPLMFVIAEQSVRRVPPIGVALTNCERNDAWKIRMLSEGFI